MNKVSAFNSFLLAGLIGVSSWIGNKVVDMGETLAILSTARLQEGERIKEIQDTLKDLRNKLGDTVTRSEFQQRLQQVEQRLSQIEAKFK